MSPISMQVDGQISDHKMGNACRVEELVALLGGLQQSLRRGIRHTSHDNVNCVETLASELLVLQIESLYEIEDEI
jgi:hypothetical protein